MYHQWLENPKTSARANKKGSASRTGRAEVGRGRDRRDEKGAARVREKEVARTIFREDLPPPVVCVYVCEFEQLNHRNFISVRRPRNITVRSVVVARDFGSGPAPHQNFLHSLAANSILWGIWGNGALNWARRIGWYKWWRRKRGLIS